MPFLHVTLIYAGLLGLLLVVLSFNLMKNWVQSPAANKASDGELRRAEALVSSFTDYVPTTLILLAFMEISGAPPQAMHITGCGLVLARLMHAYGSNYSRGSDALRFLGAQLSYLILTFASFGCLYLYAFGK